MEAEENKIVLYGKGMQSYFKSKLQIGPNLACEYRLQNRRFHIKHFLSYPRLRKAVLLHFLRKFIYIRIC